jgi:subtilisin family serine protease
MANVILVVPARAEYMASATQSLTAEEAAGAPVVTDDLPSGFTLDQSFPAVPVTQSALATVQSGVGDPSLLGQMIVRGQMDDDTLANFANDTESAVRPFADPTIEALLTCGSAPVGATADVQKLLDTPRLAGLRMDGRNTAIAIVDGGVNIAFLQGLGLLPTFLPAYSFSANGAITPGSAPTGHGSMCAFDAMIAGTAANILDHAVLGPISPGGTALQGLLSNAILSFSRLMAIMMQAAGTRPFQSMIVSNSWGVYNPSWDFPVGHAGRYIDNPNHPFNIVTAALAASGVDILFAAGNCGTTCPDGRCGFPAGDPVIVGANSHSEVMCIAGVDTNGSVVGYSSAGPGTLTSEKPDIASYTHFLGSQAFGSGTADSGTSAACPVAAGVVAALRSLYPYDPANPNRSPANVRQCFRNAAGGSSWQADVGYGIINTTFMGPGISSLA